MRSMTGFGRGDASAAEAHIVVEIKTVNHRFLEIRSRIPAELGDMEQVLERQVRNRLSRGYCTIHLTVEHSDSGRTRIDEKALVGHIAQLQEIAKRTAVSVDSLLPILASAPDLYELSRAGASDSIRAACIQACDSALGQLIGMRESEGAHMTTDIRQRMDTIAQLNSQIEVHATAHEKLIFDKYHQKISEMLATVSATETSRIETEAAIFAEKADINEEVNRLHSHINQMRSVFDEVEPIGRRMDFLVQEMGREANTIASKAVLSEITHMVVAIKGELEKIRELVQNIE
ncbi:MAG: YicC family protein [Deltaproteobacteria bacterium]|nr:YicC family protein [Deltaproteobacteria bacterium]